MLCAKAEWRFRKILPLPVRNILSIRPVRIWRLISWKALPKKNWKRLLRMAGRRNFRLIWRKSMNSGMFPMFRFMMMSHFSRESVSTCFILCSLPEETDAQEWEQRDFPVKVMRGIISGIQKCMCFQCLYTRHQSLQENFWSTVFVPWIRPGTAQRFLDIQKEPSIHGVPSMERKPPLIFRLVLPSITSMQILPMRSGCM